MQDLLRPRSERFRQASSLGRDPDRGGTWLGLRPAPARSKRIYLEPGETYTLAAISGAGIITQLWMTTFLPLNRYSLRDMVLRFYWDGELEPSVVCPFGDFFGAGFGRYTTYISEPMSITAGGFNCLWPMPFASNARLEISNEGNRPVDPFFYRVGYYELDTIPDTDLRFHARWRRENPTLSGVPFTVMETHGRGHYVGCHLFVQNREWWLRLPLARVMFPYGLGMGMLEGWESIFIDGEETASISGTGTEDFFGGSFYYYRGGTFAAPYHGCTVLDYLRGCVAAYRFDVLAPVPFREALRITIDHGFANQISGDYSCVAYWYQSEPHPPFAALPSARERRGFSSWLNLVQALLIFAPPMAIGLALLRRLWRVRRR